MENKRLRAGIGWRRDRNVLYISFDYDKNVFIYFYAVRSDSYIKTYEKHWRRINVSRLHV